MNTAFIYSKCFFLVILLQAIKGQNDDNSEYIAAELEIANLELQDDCENLANTLKSSLIKNTFTEKTKLRKTHGELLKVLAENLKSLENDIPPEFLRNWTLLVKSGDALLTEQDWAALVSYDVSQDERIHTATVHCKNDTKNCVFIKNGYENFIRSSKNEALLKKSWSAWQSLLSVKKNEFRNVLNLISKAAGPNGREDAKSYWELLLDKDDAYSAADELWDRIKPLYFKVQNFVKNRLFQFYNITSSGNEIPVYLLGSNFGNDWSYIADIVLPHPFLHRLAESHLNKTKIQDIYKNAEEVTQEMSLGSLGPDFWSNSLFNMTFCENHVISSCVQGYSQLLTCGKTSWVSYLDAFEVAIDVAVRNLDYLSLARTNLRYSAIDEAVKGMGSVFAMKNLRSTGVWDDYLFSGTEEHVLPNEMTELLLTALRVLPKLPFYLAADKYRLHLLENGFDNWEATWWNFRKEYQGVTGIFNNETDFLGDSYMTSNKPYLSKFLGIVLQFQFLEYYRHSWEDASQSIPANIANDENFLSMLNERSTVEWPSLISNYYSIYDLSADALLDYFAPLDNYLESAPLEQVMMTTTPKPITTTKQQEEPESKPLNNTEENLNVFNKNEEPTEPPMPAHHDHVEENLEGPNPEMEKISMYIGIALLAVVVGLIVFVIITKRIKKNRSNNRRFET